MIVAVCSGLTSGTPLLCGGGVCLEYLDQQMSMTSNCSKEKNLEALSSKNSF